VNEISTCDFVSNYLNIIHQQPKLDLEGYNVVSDYDDEDEEDEEEDSLTSWIYKPFIYLSSVTLFPTPCSLFDFDFDFDFIHSLISLSLS